MAACQYRWEAALAMLIPRYGLHAANKANNERNCHFWSLRIDLGARARTEGARISRGNHTQWPRKALGVPGAVHSRPASRVSKNTFFFRPCTNLYEI